MSGGRLRRFWNRRRNLILLVGLALGLLLGVRASAGRVGSLEPAELPSLGAVAAASVLLLVGQLAVGFGWRRLAPSIDDPVDSMWTFHATQPGKYLPLGIGQAVGQVTLTRDLGTAMPVAIGAWASHLAMIVTAGVTVGTLVVLRPDTGPVRWVALACLGALVFVHRPTLERIVGIGARFTRRLPAPDDLPGQRNLVEGYLACLAFVLLDGIAFAVLLGPDGGPRAWLAALGAYALAVGISTATPLPAGLGARELLLVLFVAASASSTLTMAIIVRIAIFAVEILLLSAFSALRTARRRARVR